MRRKMSSVIPPEIYRHFAMVTVLLTTGIAMFAEGENREAAVIDTAPAEASTPAYAAAAPEPAIVRRPPARRSSSGRSGFDGFDASFGPPMDTPLGSTGAYASASLTETAPTGYSERYLESLSAEERNLLLAGLATEGLLSPEERQRKSAALIAASESRSGSANY